MAAPKAKAALSFGFAKKVEVRKPVVSVKPAVGFEAVVEDKKPKNEILVETENGLVEENPEETEAPLVIPCTNPIRIKKKPLIGAKVPEADIVTAGLNKLSKEDQEAAKALLADARKDKDEEEEEEVRPILISRPKAALNDRNVADQVFKDEVEARPE